jgi:hypothetical protein
MSFIARPGGCPVLVLTALFDVFCLFAAFIYGQFPQYPTTGAGNLSFALVVIIIFIIVNITAWYVRTNAYMPNVPIYLVDSNIYTVSDVFLQGDLQASVVTAQPSQAAQGEAAHRKGGEAAHPE